MVLVFCTSHLYIPVSICLIKANMGNVCVFTDRESIYQFIKQMYPEIDLFLLKREKYRFLFITHTCVRKIKRNIKSWFDEKRIDILYFFHEGYCYEANWLIQHLWKTQKSDVVYIPIERTFDSKTEWKEIYSIKNVLKKVYFKICWGYNVHFYRYMNNTYPIMDKSFFSSVNTIEKRFEIKNTDIIDEINALVLNKMDYPESGIIWLENTLRTYAVKWDESSYKNLTEIVMPKLCNCSVFFKGHPDEALKYGKEHELKEIPSYIPGNLLLTRFSCYVGVISDLLFEAANAGTLTISTLYLFEMNENDRQLLVDYLRNRNDNIHFPKSIPEFLDLLSIQ